MPITPPKFWNEPSNPLGYLLEPLSWLYRGGGTLHRLFSKPYRAEVPVISIGNIVLGGAGKTPLTIAIAQALQKMGRTPHIITRGYGGTLRGPIRVELNEHTFNQVGDEPLLLAKHAPTWVSRNRKLAVPFAINSGADIILLDDAHQNYTLEKDMHFVVVNGLQGFGNRRVFPAGPLRQSIQTGLQDATAIVYVHQTDEPLPSFLNSFDRPILQATLVPLNPKPSRVLGFAGIGYPEKFRQSLIDAKYDVVSFTSFPDHYPYTRDDMRKLRMRARVERAHLITTEKDFLRIFLDDQKDVNVLSVRLDVQGNHDLEGILERALKL